MQAAGEGGEVGEVVRWLEGGGGGDAGEAAAALFGAVRDAWLARALLAYHARTGGGRALELLARAPDPHCRHLLDALLDQLRAEPRARRHALAALAPLVARRPTWLHRLPHHPLARELVRAARSERDPLPLLHALLALAALVPAAPAMAAPLLPELVDALLRPTTMQLPPPARDHLQLAQLALFHALYATHPNSLLDALRAELSGGGAAARDAWERGLAPLLTSVRLHPALVTGSRAREADASRWARLEAHDVVAEARRLTLHTPGPRLDPGPPPEPPVALPPEPPPDAGGAALRPGVEPWFPLLERCGAESAPHTPLPPSPEAEPPEAAVEATPENTPAKETRAQFRFPESGAVRAIGRKETSPAPGAGGEGYAGRLARVLAERRAADSPVPMIGGAAPPAGVARPEPRAVAVLGAGAAPPLAAEDREVLELTGGRPTRADDAWPEEEGAPPSERAAALDPRRLWPDMSPRRPRRAAPSPRPRPPARSASCPTLPRAGGGEGARCTVATQTVDVWPAPYEFLIADFYRSLPGSGTQTSHPYERLDAYLEQLYAGGAGGGGAARAARGELEEQLALLHAQLLYERWRRDAHAERNRRLLGRCRQARAADLASAALRDRVRQLARDNDELRARLAARDGAAPAALLAAAHLERERLDAELAAEREGRARAEALLAEAEAARATDAAELQRQRGATFEAARHIEALADAALAAERRADHVRRLRRELLVLAERETRLETVTRAALAARPPAAPSCGAAEERALRAALARAESEALAASGRAEAATARAHELETALAARDAQVAELKRAARLAAEEATARQAALRDKYAALLRVLRAAEGARLERRAAEVTWPARAAPAPGADAADDEPAGEAAADA